MVEFCTVTGTISDIFVGAFKDVTVEFKTTQKSIWRSNQKVVSTKPRRVKASDAGEIIVNLFPGQYLMTLRTNSSGADEALITVPDAPTAILAQLLDLPAPTAPNALEQAVLDAQNARDGANQAYLDTVAISGGVSAYELAVSNGYVGTEAEWLVSLTGPEGPQGLVGPQGPLGPVGPKGEKGDIGDIGPQGLQGVQGIQGLQGIEGLVGPKGDIGNTGPQGPKGDKGDQGRGLTLLGNFGTIGELPTSGNIAGDAYSVGFSSPRNIYVWDEVNIQWDNIGPLEGPAGPQGIQGETGPAGPQGEAGPVGPQGIQGESGPIGPVGPEGPQGLQGETGPVGPQGLQGLKGDTGNTGLTGPEGPIGPEGPQGLQGLQGNTGPVGLTGPEGPMGPQGIQGIPGIQGDQGNVGPQGIQGPEGPAGIQGPVGPQGEDGSVGPQGPQGETGPAGTTDYNSLENLPVLGSAAFEDTTAFATAEQGTLAASAVQPSYEGNVSIIGDLTVLGVIETENASSATTYAMDPTTNGTRATLTLIAATTLTDSLSDGEHISLRILNGDTRAVTWAAGTLWIGGSAPTLTGDDRVTFEKWGTDLIGYAGLGIA